MMICEDKIMIKMETYEKNILNPICTHGKSALIYDIIDFVLKIYAKI